MQETPDDQIPSVVHECPPRGLHILRCCGRTVFEVPRTDRMSLDDDSVTCYGVAAR